MGYLRTFHVSLPFFVFFALLAVGITTYFLRNSNPEKIFATNVPVRGESGDFWADIVIGKRSFEEISPREVVPYKVSAPGGVIVDRSVNPGRMYVWDSGNSRILGVDLAQCYTQGPPCNATIVIGQPSGSDFGACNHDASFGSYPNRLPASASTLCGIPESTHTTLEDKSFVSMFVDQDGNLYVGDSRNHRVLKYLSPFTTDTVADDVWGQNNFSDNGCNGTGGIGGGFNGIPAPAPSQTSLCFHTIGASGAGVTLDTQGNMWIADGGNNRVLMYANENGTIAKNATLVLGQINFTTGGDFSHSNASNRMSSPAAVRVAPDGKVYVADSGNNRILVFTPPLSSGMNASTILNTDFSYPTGLELDPDGRGFFVYDFASWDGRTRLFDFDGNLIQELPRLSNHGGGSIGIDAQGNILTSTYVYGQDVHKFIRQTNGTYTLAPNLFSPPSGYNLTTPRRLEHPAWTGIAISGTQLIVSDGRLQFWNGLPSLTSGQDPDGFVGAPSGTSLPQPGFGQVKTDAVNHIWVTKQNQVQVYNAPLTTNATPIATLSAIPVLGGGQIMLNDAHGIAPSADASVVWISQPGRHHVLRVRNPLTNPLIDIILGQTSTISAGCNRGAIPAPNTGTSLVADLTMLCFPGALAIDKNNNLYVSDHFIEAEGNWRLLMFSSSTFPDNPASLVYAPAAAKEFPKSTPQSSRAHMVFEPAFDSTNRMVIGHNPYSGKRFVSFYNQPAQINPVNPRDPAYAVPDGTLNDFSGWPVAITFDSNDNLYVYDANRGQVRVYYHPFNTPVNTATPVPATPTATPAATLTPTPTSLPTPVPSNTPTPAPVSVTLTAIEDSYVSSSNPNTNYGKANTMDVDGNPVRIAYIKFNLQSLAGKTVKTAKLRLRVTNASPGTFPVKFVANTSWAENSIKYSNRPALSNTLGTITNPVNGQYVEVDLASAVGQSAGQASFTVGIDTTHTDNATFNSRQVNVAANRPQLLITYQ